MESVHVVKVCLYNASAYSLHHSCFQLRVILKLLILERPFHSARRMLWISRFADRSRRYRLSNAFNASCFVRTLCKFLRLIIAFVWYIFIYIIEFECTFIGISFIWWFSTISIRSYLTILMKNLLIDSHFLWTVMLKPIIDLLLQDPNIWILLWCL